MAVGLLSALREQGIVVPQDMAVVGFDDVASARFLSPPLTTVRVDAFALGKQAVELMLETMTSGNGGDCPHRILPATLTVRESCGARTGEHPRVAGRR
jgi:LacI family transcriptional regulator